MDERTFRLARDAPAARRTAEAVFAMLARELTPILPRSTEILHIGATAVPGCLTKGDLDIVVRVDTADFAQAERCLAGRFARNRRSARLVDFAAFEDDGCAIPLGIQLTAKGGRYDDFHRFVAALRADPELLQRYNDLKQRFDGQAMETYRHAKGAFVDAVLREFVESGRSAKV